MGFMPIPAAPVMDRLACCIVRRRTCPQLLCEEELLLKTLALISLLTCAQTDLSENAPLVPWPENIGAYVRESMGGQETIGYSRQQLSSFPGYRYRLGYVSRLFADAEALPGESHQFAECMLAGDYGTAVAAAMRLLGAKIEPAEPGEPVELKIEPMDAAAGETWQSLPEPVHRAVGELVNAAWAARADLHKAFDWDGLSRATGDARVGNLSDGRAYRHAANPWLSMSGATAASLSALNTLDATALGNAGERVWVGVRSAIDQLRLLGDEPALAKFPICRLKTPVGTVAILSRGADVYRGSDAIVIDLGGNDRYSGRLAVPVSKSAPVGLLIDLGGDDVYDGRSAPASLACGLFGIGALFDLAGEDQYYCDQSGLGCAWHGIGLLFDAAGNDQYHGRQWCQGAAHAGVGMLMDDAGADKYHCQLESQGLGSTLGIGVLVDRQGNDKYHAYDNENGRRITFPSSQTKSHEVSLVQGCGYGRRADSGDGVSIAGGVGALVDGGGDDSYYGGVFSQAVGFWWGAGMLVDYGGHDTYRGVYYAQGAAAHFAVGSLVDLDGNDRYNDRGVLGQVLGAGRDGSVATALDVGGNDIYYLPKKSGGGGDMNSIGLLCDKAGEDQYLPTGYSYLGSASFSNPRGERFRQGMPTIGLFVDLAGEDKYPSGARATNNRRWFHQSGAPTWGMGLDTDRKP